MKTTGLVLDERPYIGEATPPASFEDASRYGNDGTHTNVTWAQRPSGLWERSYNGNGYATCGSNPVLDFTSGAFTISVWISPTGVLAQAEIFCRGRHNETGYRLFYSSTGQIYFYTYQTAANDSTSSAAGEIVTSNTYHVVAVRDGNSVCLYKNGEDVTNTAGVHIDPLTSPRTPRFGIYDTLIDGVVGALSMGKIWNYALSAEQIPDIFEKERHYFGV